MKRILILAAIVLLSSTFMNAETRNEPQIKTLFGDKKMTHSGWLGLQMKGTQLDGDLAFLIGGKGGWLINRKFTIGFAGYGNIPSKDYTGLSYYYNEDSIIYDSKLSRFLGYGGLYLEYIINPLDLIHFTGSVLLGGGGVSYSKMGNMNGNMNKWDEDYNMNNIDSYPSQGFFVIEPELSVEMNITKFAKIGVAASYRFMRGIDNNEAFDLPANKSLKDINLSGVSGSLYFSFGWF